MGPQKFTGSNTAEALKLVKAKMGSEAMVLSTKDTENGVEIVAISPEDLQQMSNQPGNLADNSFDEKEASFNPQTKVIQSGQGDPLASRYENGNNSTSESNTRRPLGSSLNTGPNVSSNSASMSTQMSSPMSIADALQSNKKKKMLSPDDMSDFVPSNIKSVNFPSLSEVENRQSASNSNNPSDTTSKNARSSTQAPSGDANASVSNVEQLLSEIADVKQLLQSQVAGNLWNTIQQENSGHAEIVKHLLNVGFSPKLCAEIVKNLPKAGDFDDMLNHARSQIEGMFRTIDSFSIFDQGGVFAFIGPTGVGKTTTVAKIAARCVLRYGRNQVALLTTDTYRIGAQEQLKVFAKILGLPVVSLRDSDDLSSKLKELSNRKVILLDTAGVSQRDTLMVEQSQMLQDGSRNAFRILVMSSTTDLRTQEDVIMLHNQAAKAKDMPGIGAVVITKTDEATQLAPVIDCLVRHDLPLMFLSNGQRVPEDLSQPDIAYLSHRAMHSRSYTEDISLNDDQIPAVLSDHLNDWIKKVKQ